MLRMVRLRLLGVQGDGNCAYYAALGGLDAPTLAALGLPRLDHLGTQLPPTVRDLQVVGVLREHCTDWLQLDAHAEHRRVGTFGGDIYESAPGSYVMPPPPSASSVEPHRALGTYAQVPQLRALAEVLQLGLVTIDMSTLFDRVLAYTPGRKQTVRLSSWSSAIAPCILALRAGTPLTPEQRQLVGANGIAVIVSNGRLDAGGHFDATARLPDVVPALQRAPALRADAIGSPSATRAGKATVAEARRALLQLAGPLRQLKSGGVAVPSGGRGEKANVLHARNAELAASLGLTGCAKDSPRHIWLNSPSTEEARLASVLAAEAEDNAAHAHLQSRDEGRRTALNAFAEFRAALPNRQFYIKPSSPHDIKAHTYNRESDMLLAQFIRNTRGITSKSISKYVSGVRVTVEEDLNLRLSAPGIGFNYNRLLQQYRREDGPSGERELSLPIRAAHIQQLAAPDSGFDSTGSRWAVIRWSLVLTGLHALLRGCEPGVAERSHPFEPALHITCAAGRASDVRNAWQWLSAEQYNGKVPCVVLLLLSKKDKDAHVSAVHKKRKPIFMPRQKPVGDNSLTHICPYDALAAAWRVMETEVPPTARATTPFFTFDDGRVVCTDDVESIVRLIVRTLELGNPSDYGAKALRIGGATDILALCKFDFAAAEALCRARGRWSSTVAQVYMRLSALVQGDVSAGMALVADASIEMLTGWVQPAVRIS